MSASFTNLIDMIDAQHLIVIAAREASNRNGLVNLEPESRNIGSHDSTAIASMVEASASEKRALSLSGYVLVVDDNEANRKAAVAILACMGIRADTVADGQQAVRAVHSRNYDLVLMDCHMPVFDGYEATTSIRLWEMEEHRATLPIIALLANTAIEDRERCAACGMNDFLAKPIDALTAHRIMERWLPKRTAEPT